MENPASWKRAEWAVRRALDVAFEAREKGLCGLSMERHVTDELRREGLLNDEHEEPCGTFSDPSRESPVRDESPSL